MSDYKIVVVAIIEYNGQVLVGKKINSNHFLSGVWHIPGGKLELNETEEQALVREMREEAGIEIKVGEFLDERVVPDANVKTRWYLCSPLTHDLSPGDDLSEVKYVPKSDVISICDPKAISFCPPRVIEYLSQ